MKHYSYLARLKGYKAVHAIQKFGARMHQNHLKLTADDLRQPEMGKDKLQIRYGVIELDAMLRDMRKWDTLLVSSFL